MNNFVKGIVVVMCLMWAFLPDLIPGPIDDIVALLMATCTGFSNE